MTRLANGLTQTKRNIEQAIINLQYYSGNDEYSDGDIERELLAIVKGNTDFDKILASETRWPILCHLSPLRRNLLEWYSFKDNAAVLEIGAGCGALTGMFCEKAAKVVAVELSKQRAEIIAQRNCEHSNLEIMAGNFNDMVFDQQFDYITLIGVLEYAAIFTKSDKPHADFLACIRRLLKPDGELILAIENRFGLKYWAGAREDHTGQLFSGLEGYVGSDGAKTFGKYELTQLLAAAGFTSTEYYYPLPDYKLPKQIYSQYLLPAIGQFDGYSPNYDQDRSVIFNEKLVCSGLIKNNQFEFFANSFLVFAK